MNLKGKKFLLIGGAGLIGSHTLDQLLKEDVKKIIIYDNFSRGNFDNIKQALKDPRVSINDQGGDILHTDILDNALKNIDGVFHFAALWLLHCHKYPQSAFDVNVKGTFNVIELCVKNKIKKLVYSSSASVYGDAITEPIEETHPFNNKNFYGATKIASEAMLRSYYYRYNLNYIGLRYMNVYGSRQDYKGAYISVIMKMLDLIDMGRSPEIQGTGNESYDFVYVEDCAKANILAMKSNKKNIFLNVGTGKRTSLKKLAETILQLKKVKNKIKYIKSKNKTIVKNRIGSTKKAKKEIKYEFSVNLKEGLRKTIEWKDKLDT